MMSSVVKSKCPDCKTPVAVEEEQASLPVTCSSCQSKFVPAEVNAASDKRFEIGMYVGMLVVGVGLLVYMAMTGRLNPQGAAPPAPAPQAPAAVGAEAE